MPTTLRLPRLRPLAAAVWCTLAVAQPTALPTPRTADLQQGADALAPTPPTPEPAAARDPQAEALFQHALKQVLARDPQIKAAQANLRGVEAQWRQVRSRWLPTLGITANQGQSDDEDLGLPVQRSTERTEAQLRWNLFAGGADLALQQALSQEIEAARQDLVRAQEESVERFLQAWSDAERARAIARVAEELLDRLTGLKDLVDRQVTLGKVSQVDADTSASSLLEVRVNLIDAQAEARQAFLKLSALSGLPSQTLQSMALPPLGAPTDLSTADWLDLRQGSSRWQAARLRAEAAQTRLGLVNPDLLPRADVQWRQALHDRTTPPASSVSRRGSTITLSLDIPLGGEAFARRDENIERAQAALAEAERASRDAQMEWADSADKLHTATYNLGIFQRQMRHLTRVLAGSAIQYEAGRRTLVQVIELHRLPFATQQKMADARRVSLQAQVRMLNLSGGLLDALQLPRADAAQRPR